MQDARSGPFVSRFAMEVGFSLAILAAGVVVITGARQFDIAWTETGPSPGFFPLGIGIVIVAGSLVALAQAFVVHRRGHREAFLDREQARRVVSFGLPILAFVVLALWIGMYVAMALYLFAVTTYQGGFRVRTGLLVGLGTAIGFYVVFDIWFRTPLLKGPLEAWLGLH